MVNQNIVIITGELISIESEIESAAIIELLVVREAKKEKIKATVFNRNAEIINKYAEIGDNITLNCHIGSIMGFFQLSVDSIAFVGGSFKERA